MEPTFSLIEGSQQQQSQEEAPKNYIDAVVKHPPKNHTGEGDEDIY